MAYWSSFPRYVSIAERRAQAEKLKIKHGNLEPVLIDGGTIASSWWGKSWNKNLERYADYSNRIGRGRSYVRNGMVLDLKIEKETIKAIVAGSRSTPYQVRVRIKTLPPATWKRLVKQACGRIESMHALLAGRFPEELKDLFFSKGSGLFPKPAEILFDCSCPDWASMCKHVAAALYGVGARLDSSPRLFFALRGVSMDELVGQVAKKESEKLLSKEKVRSSRIMESSGKGMKDLEALFGISMAAARETAGPPKNAPAGGTAKSAKRGSSLKKKRTTPGKT